VIIFSSLIQILYKQLIYFSGIAIYYTALNMHVTTSLRCLCVIKQPCLKTWVQNGYSLQNLMYRIFTLNFTYPFGLFLFPVF